MNEILAGKRVLIVEDEYFIASDLKRALQKHDVEVVGPVGDLAAGLRLAESERLDAAVLDVNLESDFSFAIADRLTHNDVPVMFVTGYDGWALPEAYRDQPRLAKPFPVSTVVAMVEQLCGGAP